MELIVLTLSIVGMGTGLLSLAGFAQGMRPLMMRCCVTLLLGVCIHTSVFMFCMHSASSWKYQRLHGSLGIIIPLAIACLLLEPLVFAPRFQRKVQDEFEASMGKLDSPLFNYRRWLSAPVYSSCYLNSYVRATVSSIYIYKNVTDAPNPTGYYKRVAGNGWTRRGEYFYSEYSPSLGKDLAGRGPNMVLDVHGSVSTAKTVLIFFHAGCLTWGNRSAINGCMVRELLSQGHAVVSVEYRLTGWGWNGSHLLEDVHDSIYFVEQMCTHAKLVLWGESGGAQLALLGAYTYPLGPQGSSASIVGVVADSPQVNMRLARSCREGFCSSDYDDQFDNCWEALSPLTHVSQLSPATLIFSGKFDIMTSQTQPRMLVSALNRSGVSHIWVQSPNSGHVVAFNVLGSLNFQVYSKIFSQFLVAMGR